MLNLFSRKTFSIQFFILMICLNYSTASANDYKVLVHSGHVYSADLVDKSLWPIVSDMMDGFWVATPTFRGLTLEQKIAIKNNGAKINAVAEIPFQRLQEGTYHNIDAAEESGMDVDTVMVYNEDVWGSTLPPSQVIEAKKALSQRCKYYKLILNIRLWNTTILLEDKTLPEVLLTADGFSYEFEVSKDTTKLNNLIEAIKWGVDNNKIVYLLTPPNKNDHNIDRNYLKDYQFMRNYIKPLIGDRYSSNLLRWIPANYNFYLSLVGGAEETIIINGGSYNANTTMGVCRWLVLIR